MLAQARLDHILQFLARLKVCIKVCYLLVLIAADKTFFVFLLLREQLVKSVNNWICIEAQFPITRVVEAILDAVLAEDGSEVGKFVLRARGVHIGPSEDTL